MGGGDPFGYGAAAAFAAAVGATVRRGTRDAVGVRTDIRAAPAVRAAVARAARTMTANAAPNNRLQRTVRKSGKRIGKRELVQKIVSGAAQPIVERYQRLQNLDAGSGVVPFSYEPTAVTGTQYYPLYMFDLTSTPNQFDEIGNAAGQNVKYPAVLYRLTREYNTVSSTDLNNVYQFVPTSNCTALMSDGATTTYGWSLEKAPRTKCFPMGSSHLDWLDFRFMFYGPTNQHVNIYLNLVQFTDDKYLDYYVSSSSTGISYGVPTATGEDQWYKGSEDRAREWNEFWAGQVDRLVSSPLNKRDAYNLKGLKTLLSEKITMTPGDNDALGQKGARRMYKLFKRINRVIRYQWEREADFTKAGTDRTGTGVPPNKEADPNVWDTKQPQYAQDPTSGFALFTDCQVAPRPRARMYLMLSAECPITGAPTTTNNASFDFCVRRKRTCMGGL